MKVSLKFIMLFLVFLSQSSLGKTQFSASKCLSKYTVIGIISGSNPLAVIKDDETRKTHFLRIGDVIDDDHQVKVKAIDVKKVIVTDGSKVVSLNYRNFEKFEEVDETSPIYDSVGDLDLSELLEKIELDQTLLTTDSETLTSESDVNTTEATKDVEEDQK